jgi:PAP2 superfamily
LPAVATLIALAMHATAAAQVVDSDPCLGTTAVAAPPAAVTPAGTLERSGFSQFFREVGGDYKHTFTSRETAFWHGGGLAAPSFALATYTAISRLTINVHWASDVTFGAIVGLASARTVTLHLRHERFALTPVAAPAGGGIALTRVN